MDAVEWLLTLALEPEETALSSAKFAALSEALVNGAQTVKGDTVAARKLDFQAVAAGKLDLEKWRAYISKLGELLGSEQVQASVQDCATRQLEESVGRALGEARRDPKGFAKRIEARLPNFEGKNYVADGRRIVTKEGKSAVNDALAYLRAQDPIQPVLPGGEGLRLAAEDHANDIGRNGLVSHTGSDGSSASDRQSRYGTWSGSSGECLWYGRAVGRTGRGVIEDLVIDDGVASRGHRLAIFNTSFTVAGVKLLPHEIYGHVVAIEFAGAYVDDNDAVRKRERVGPPKITSRPSSGSGETQWKLGCCGGCGKPVKGGAVVELCGSNWHKDCFACSKCSCSLSGVPYMTEAKKLFCKSCHTEDFGKECAGCGKKIAGRVLTTQGKTWHEECFKKSQAEDCATKPAAAVEEPEQAAAPAPSAPALPKEATPFRQAKIRLGAAPSAPQGPQPTRFGQARIKLPM
jgi:uncharacterized protein YkwD